MAIVLETERLALREFTRDDADLLVELDSDPEVMRFLTGGQPTEREYIEQQVLPTFLEDYGRFPGFGIWAAETRAAGFVGWFELRPANDSPPGEVVLGYRLRRPAWGRGYATEGGRALLHRGFDELGVRTIVAETMAVNKGSRRVMEKLGLSHRDTYFPDLPPIPGSEHGEVRYTITLAEWQAS
jgi:RimJ/RimL family protein N-acetyltransferase